MNINQQLNITARFSRRTNPKPSFGAPATPAQIMSAERELRVSLPDDYKWFMLNYGATSWPDYIYGLGDGVPTSFTVTALTHRERTLVEPAILLPLVPFAGDGFGNHYCLNTSQLNYGICPVVFWDHDLDENQVPEVTHPSFLDWLDEFTRESEESEDE